MPITPFHAGYPIIAGLLARNWFSLPAALIGAVIIDLEPLFRILSGAPTSHDHFHTFAAAVIIGFALGLLVYVFRRKFDSLTGRFGIRQVTTMRSAFVGALFGTLSHVALDLTMHSPGTGFRGLWPFSDATFFDPAMPWLITIVSAVVLVVAGLVYTWVVVRENR